MRVFRDLLIMTGSGQSGLGVSWNAGKHGRQRKNQTSRHRAHLLRLLPLGIVMGAA